MRPSFVTHFTQVVHPVTSPIRVVAYLRLIAKLLPGLVVGFGIGPSGTVELRTTRYGLRGLLRYLEQSSMGQFDTLIDLVAVDYPGNGRFLLKYTLLSH
jgi:hypothetical protein